MAKINWGTLIGLGVLGVLAYFLFTKITGGDTGIGGGGSGGTEWWNTTTTTTTTTTIENPLSPQIPVPLPNVLPPGKTLPPNYFIKYTPEQITAMHNEAGTTQRWTGAGVSYGSPGQPSVAFKENTIKAAAPVKTYTLGIGKVSPVVAVQTPAATKIVIAKPLAVSTGSKPVVVTKAPLAVTQTKIAAAAISAGAPPRVVAKIKGGTFY